MIVVLEARRSSSRSSRRSSRRTSRGSRRRSSSRKPDKMATVSFSGLKLGRGAKSPKPTVVIVTTCLK